MYYVHLLLGTKINIMPDLSDLLKHQSSKLVKKIV